MSLLPCEVVSSISTVVVNGLDCCQKNCSLFTVFFALVEEGLTLKDEGAGMQKCRHKKGGIGNTTANVGPPNVVSILLATSCGEQRKELNLDFISL